MTNPITTMNRERLEELVKAIDSEAYDEEEIVGFVNSHDIFEMARALLAVMDAQESPFMFAICNPDGSAWLDENCVADTENNLKPVLNDLRRDSGDDYYISPLYTTPPAPSVPDGYCLVKKSDVLTVLRPSETSSHGFSIPIDNCLWEAGKRMFKAASPEQ